MNILFLGYGRDKTRLIDFLSDKNVVEQTDENVADKIGKYDFVISFGYKYIMKREHLSLCPRPPINLHISLLPFNRGRHPNFWAWYENTPHGVSIHHIDAGIDTGDIIVQKEIEFGGGTTLSESYEILRDEIESLFILHSDRIIQRNYTPFKQSGPGTSHRVADLPEFEGGWNQRIADIIAEKSRHKVGQRS